jgi:hypothetical protein
MRRRRSRTRGMRRRRRIRRARRSRRRRRRRRTRSRRRGEEDHPSIRRLYSPVCTRSIEINNKLMNNNSDTCI